MKRAILKNSLELGAKNKIGLSLELKNKVMLSFYLIYS